jgi:chaperonin cofactor prefoldin
MSLESLTPDEQAYLNIGKLLLEHPETKRDTQRLIKKARPQTVIADLEMEDALDKRTADLKKQQEALEERLNKDALERKIEAERAKIREAGGDVTALEAFMKENELYSYEKAWKIFQQVNVPASPTPSSLISEVKGMKGDDAKSLWKNPAQWAREQAASVLNELRGKVA